MTRSDTNKALFAYAKSWFSHDKTPLKYFFCALSVVKRLCDIDQLQHGVEMGKSARKKTSKEKLPVGRLTVDCLSLCQTNHCHLFISRR